MDTSFLNTVSDKNSELCKNACNEGNANEKYSEKPIAEAAIGAEKPTIKDSQPLKNPSNGLKSLVIKIYSPPASGKVAPNSPKAIAPQKAIIPPANHSKIISMGFSRNPIIKPEVVKIPAPIIFAITMLVTGKSPSFLGNLMSELFKKSKFSKSKIRVREKLSIPQFIAY